jgi:antiviral helicase SKI2
MLLQGGTSKGLEPSVKVMEIAQNPDRKADDLLPYLGSFAKFFRNLPKSPQDLILKTAYVPLNDIECLTKTIIDIPDQVQNLSRKKDILKLAQDQFLPLCQSWNYEDWDEYDYSRITNLKFRELMEARAQEGQNAVNKECLKCPDFLKHFQMEHDQWLIKENILSLRQLMSDQNLQLLPDYEQRIRVLQDLGFIDEGSRVELKGKVACEVGSISSSCRRVTDYHPDPFRRRARLDRTGSRERSGGLHPRRDRRSPLCIRVSRENRRRAHANRQSRARCRCDRQDFRKGQRHTDLAPGHPVGR